MCRRAGQGRSNRVFSKYLFSCRVTDFIIIPEIEILTTEESASIQEEGIQTPDMMIPILIWITIVKKATTAGKENVQGKEFFITEKTVITMIENTLLNEAWLNESIFLLLVLVTTTSSACLVSKHGLWTLLADLLHSSMISCFRELLNICINKYRYYSF